MNLADKFFEMERSDAQVGGGRACASCGGVVVVEGADKFFEMERSNAQVGGRCARVLAWVCVGGGGRTSYLRSSATPGAGAALSPDPVPLMPGAALDPDPVPLMPGAALDPRPWTLDAWSCTVPRPCTLDAWSCPGPLTLTGLPCSSVQLYEVLYAEP